MALRLASDWPLPGGSASAKASCRISCWMLTLWHLRPARAPLGLQRDWLVTGQVGQVIFGVGGGEPAADLDGFLDE
jgi:hypothetical protein